MAKRLLFGGQSDEAYLTAWEREERTRELADAFPDTPPTDEETEAMYQAHCAEVARGER